MDSNPPAPRAAQTAQADLPYALREALELAWASLCDGNMGIGSVLVDGRGMILASGRNVAATPGAIEYPLRGCYIAHAELNALGQVDKRTSLRDASLYTTMSPCVMCFGAAIAAHVGRLVYIVNDPLYPNLARIKGVGPMAEHKWPTVERLGGFEWRVIATVLAWHIKYETKSDGFVAQGYRSSRPIAAQVLDAVRNESIWQAAIATGQPLSAVLSLLRSTIQLVRDASSRGAD